jgi:hypothetical protein
MRMARANPTIHVLGEAVKPVATEWAQTEDKIYALQRFLSQRNRIQLIVYYDKSGFLSTTWCAVEICILWVKKRIQTTSGIL